jgi:hypothetical protein
MVGIGIKTINGTDRVTVTCLECSVEHHRSNLVLINKEEREKN